MRSLSPLVAILLSGCLFVPGHCGLSPDSVGWDDPAFYDSLRTSAGENWTVQVIDAPPGLPTEDPTLASWNATVQRLYARLMDPWGLTLNGDGRLSIHEVPDPIPEDLSDVLQNALSDITTGNESQRQAWVESLLEKPGLSGYGRDHTGNEVIFRSYSVQLPLEAIHIDGLLGENLPGERPDRIRVDGWSIEFDYPQVKATRGTQVFTASVHGSNGYSDMAWQGEFHESRALGEFHVAYASLGIGKSPDQAYVGGSIC